VVWLAFLAGSRISRSLQTAANIAPIHEGGICSKPAHFEKTEQVSMKSGSWSAA
jgi:hypothetical protein